MPLLEVPGIGPVALALAGFALGVVVVALGVRTAARALYYARRRGSPDAAMARAGREVAQRLDFLERRVHATRRGQYAPAELISLVSAALDEIAAASARVAGLPAATRGDAAGDILAQELMRASQALESILDACLSLEGTTDADRRARAATALKWGYVNLVDAQSRLADEVTSLESGARRRKSWWRASRI